MRCYTWPWAWKGSWERHNTKFDFRYGPWNVRNFYINKICQILWEYMT